ncbi:MAG TPA: hypothetical protein PK033_13760 [Acetivibrio sp.]|nr:hypothetical protein [Acetivibrio sp.]
MKIDLNALNSSIKRCIVMEMYLAIKSDNYIRVEEIAKKAKQLTKLERIAKH